MSRQTLAGSARHLSRRNKATPASYRRPSAPLVLSSAGKLIRYLHGSHFLPYHSADVFRFCFFIPHLCLSVTQLGCSLKALSSTPLVDTPLTADWLQVCFGSRPGLFSKAFLKNDIPHLYLFHVPARLAITLHAYRTRTTSSSGPGHS